LLGLVFALLALALLTLILALLALALLALIALVLLTLLTLAVLRVVLTLLIRLALALLIRLALTLLIRLTLGLLIRVLVTAIRIALLILVTHVDVSPVLARVRSRLDRRASARRARNDYATSMPPNLPRIHGKNCASSEPCLPHAAASHSVL
jgi:hypothetical protein